VTTTPFDPEAVRTFEHARWQRAAGVYEATFAGATRPFMEALLDAAQVGSGTRILDIACGPGLLASGACARGAVARGVDFSPAMLAVARARDTAVQFDEGDAEALPFGNDQFDVVSSVFGAMFAPNQEQTASELLRVTRPGGRIGLASWTPEGFIGQFFKVNGRHVPPPAGVRPPLQWGTTERLSELFADAIVDFRVERRFYTFRAQTPEAWIDHFRRWYGPTLKSFEAVGAPGAEALEADLLELIASLNRADAGTMVVPSEYLEAVLVKA